MRVRMALIIEAKVVNKHLPDFHLQVFCPGSPSANTRRRKGNNEGLVNIVHKVKEGLYRGLWVFLWAVYRPIHRGNQGCQQIYTTCASCP